MPRWLQRFRDFRRDALSEARLAETLRRLVADGELTPNASARLQAALDATRHESQYILGHLCAHLAIGIITPDILFLPLGMLGRGLWVAGSRTYEAFRQNPRGPKVHTAWVLLISLLPYAGNFAYLIPLKAANADAPYLYANHITYLRQNCSLEASLRRKPRWLQRMLRGVLASVMEKPRE